MNARARRLAPFAGYLMVAFILVALFMMQAPESKASGAKVISFFTHHKTAVHVQSLLLAYGALTAIVFFTAVANFVRSRGSQILATTSIVGGALMAAGLCIGAGINETLVDQPGRLSVASAQTLNLLSTNAFGVLLIAGVALAWLSAGIAMLRTKSMPTALGVVTTIVGVVSTAGPLGWIGFLATALLAPVVATYVYLRSEQPPAEITLPDAKVTVPAQARRTKSDAKSDAGAKTSA